MDVKETILNIIEELFMEDVSEMMDEDLFDAGVLDSMGTVELIVELESRFNVTVPVSEFGREDWNTANKIISGVVELMHA
ncbi:D-alanine--poly(phosphoribitol) ligase subunit DltC [Streptococcus suis]|uniref:D-alanine--poly(phosphoribitol) ligase subunit DltC n=1 Tax=Streptococcus suis TaxID=1307 RepID=UPI00040F0BE5|nr:D-alanine--poly(phosphoribitol) ligase subunit DltC [Streptococcus suis]MCK3848766.1 D-alanine--poly(phosphoribitol) ligase subunit DltC [Streptococcus suis]MCK4022131.1 D-alanine--poly(phosphoribitol) ligase subunit DltC [Streptococcus suis]NQJ61423.1 D-alanine--poly(phosphoribitol) ligase subunit DltC [Streptococcus suis]NQJ65449.1 D-alanine--poly(phosphoribitol) ligase subunit DltC [Streptococcus suis]NQJ65765.1 D-alanine--poly(phosphoribitol) ligase subunit DltC [Streptococcus suis]